MEPKLLEHIENLRHTRELYAVTALQWRFLLGLRAATLASFVAMIGVLISALWQFVVIVANGARPAHSIILTTIPYVGLYGTYFVLMIDQLVHDLMEDCALRGISEESTMSINNGIFKSVTTHMGKDRRFYSRIVTLALTIVVLAWVALICVATLVATGLIR